MKAILYNEGSGPALREVPVPRPQTGGALIEVEACGLCGTDLLKIRKKNPGAVLGHEVVGRVQEINGGKNSGLGVGDRVIVGHHVPCGDCHYCRRDSPSMCAQFKSTNITPGGFAQFLSVSPLHVSRSVLRIPETLAAADACQIEPLACCVRNARRLGLGPGDRAAVIGLGSIGFLTAQLLRLDGAEVLGLDLDAARIKTASPWTKGFANADDLRRQAQAATEGRGLDAIVVTAGSAALAAESLSWLRHGGTLNIFAAPSPSAAGIDWAEIYHKELRVLSSYSSTPDDLRRALDLIASGTVRLDAIKAKPYSLEEFGQAVDDALSRRVMKALIVP
ncbi:MAG: alcohol dehydrogenase catalytic domain-containing protein [Elusimicrobiota bacterium]